MLCLESNGIKKQIKNKVLECLNFIQKDLKRFQKKDVLNVGIREILVPYKLNSLLDEENFNSFNCHLHTNIHKFKSHIIKKRFIF